MVKRYVAIACVVSLFIGSCSTAETQQAYEQEQRKYGSIITALFASFIGWSAWSTRDKIVGQILKNNDGVRVFDDADLFAWLTKIEKTDVHEVKIVSGANLTDIYTIENQTVPFRSTIDYKIMLGIAAALGVYAVYSAYKLFVGPQERTEV